MSCIRWKWVESFECWFEVIKYYLSLWQTCRWPFTIGFDFNAGCRGSLLLELLDLRYPCYGFFTFLHVEPIECHGFFAHAGMDNYTLYFDTIVWHHRRQYLSLQFSWALGPGQLKRFPSISHPVTSWDSPWFYKPSRPPPVWSGNSRAWDPQFSKFTSLGTALDIGVQSIKASHFSVLLITTQYNKHPCDANA